MKALIGNEVKTDVANYPFKSREEAEGFYFAVREREARKRTALPETPLETAKQPQPKR
jgi:hypothetical protein